MQTVTYKYRVKDRSARKTLARQAMACNQVWNYCNAFQRDLEARYRAGALKRRWPSAFDLAKLCKGTGKDLGIHQQTVGTICDQFAKSRDKAEHSLRFRSSFGAKRALGWVPFQKQSRQVEGNSIWYLGKQYRFFGSKRRPLPDNAKGGAFVEDASGRWYVCFHVEVAERQPRGNGVIGIDLGLNTLVSTSDGQKIKAPGHYRQLEAKLAIAQRARNRQHVRHIHAKIKNTRKDFLHKLSTTLADQNAIIAVGDVNSKQLAKTRMAKSVLDAGWSTFRSMLKYKSAGYVEVDEKFTTVTCSACGVRGGPQGQKGLRVREWQCSACGADHDRDVNSALNILAIAARSAAGPVVESRVAA
jgi:IS605 OrfB family transposase